MNVLVYCGPEVVQASLNATISSLRSILLPNYSIQTVTQQVLTLQPWSASCALLVFPECRKPFQSKSSSAIQTYVENGGSLLGIATGAVFSTHGLEPEISNMTVGESASREPMLRFRQMTTGGYLYPVYSLSNEGSTPSLVTLKPVGRAEAFCVFETSRRAFVGIERISQGLRPLAQYILPGSEEQLASISYDFGRGKVILCAPSMEYNLLEEPVKSSQLPTSSIPEDRVAEEAKRYQFFQDTLLHLGLHLSSTQDHPNSHPLPQFLIGNPAQLHIVSRVLDQIKVNPSHVTEYQDSNDTFRFHPPTSIDSVLSEARSASRSVSESSSGQPKHIIVLPDSNILTQVETPLFNFSLFFDTLTSARVREGINQYTDTWYLGDALLYGEIVTSTQTMLDKNTRLLSSLPVPFLSLASYQLAGRGRGTNVWLSPAGCLQFSILLRVSLSNFPANKLVFVQYLFALAVAEACRSEDVLGSTGRRIRLKWPNDLYASMEDDLSATKKIGGILVNTSFSNGKVDIVIGCGINVLNVPPIPSLAQLLAAKSNGPLSMEKTLAAILTKFDSMWNMFVQGRGSFEPFMDLYLERWLHSDQLVTVMTTTPHQRVRIVGITPDHGLLRTIPETISRNSFGKIDYVDLQPDGNSFDLMHGMIKSKT